MLKCIDILLLYSLKTRKSQARSLVQSRALWWMIWKQ